MNSGTSIKTWFKYASWVVRLSGLSVGPDRLSIDSTDVVAIAAVVAAAVTTAVAALLAIAVEVAATVRLHRHHHHLLVVVPDVINVVSWHRHVIRFRRDNSFWKHVH